jgi:hypothetical protein
MRFLIGLDDVPYGNVKMVSVNGVMQVDSGWRFTNWTSLNGLKRVITS